MITEKIPFWCTEPIQDKYDHWIYRDILSYHKLGIGIGNKMDLNRILNHPQRFLFDPRFFKTDGSLKQLMHVAATLPDGKWKRSKAMDSVEDMFYLFKKLEDKSPVDTLQILESFGRYKIFLHDYAEYRNMSPGELYFFGTVTRRMQKNIMIGKNGMRTFENIKSFYRNNCESMMESLCQHCTVQKVWNGIVYISSIV